MRILITATSFARYPDSNITTDLADEFAAQGHDVTAVWMAWQQQLPETDEVGPSGVRVVAGPAFQPRWLPAGLRKLAKWTLTGARARRRMKALLPGVPFDLVVGFAPAVIFRQLVTWARARGAFAYLVHWDFFPVHHLEIGMMRSRVAATIGKVLERNAISEFDAVGFMSPRNQEFFRRYHPGLSDLRGEILPLWGATAAVPEVERDEVRRSAGIPQNAVAVVFGGQLSAGRGLEAILDLADRVRVSLPETVFLVIGAGTYFERIRLEIEMRRAGNVRLLARLGRENYLRLLKACDIGIVATVPGVTVPTFPSKTVDYLRAGLPILASTEETTDFGSIIENEAQAGLASIAGDLDGLEANLHRLAREPALREALGRSGREYFSRRMSATKACRQILSAVEQGRPAKSQ